MNKELNEAADFYARERNGGNPGSGIIQQSFKAGAQWQAEQKQVPTDGWIDVKDEPTEGQFCLVFNSISVEPSVYTKGNFYRYPNEVTGDRCSLYHFDKAKVTHWQPLPNPPQQ